MGRESTITFEQVCAAADSIKAAGGKPTSRNVRERLGTGSMGTIHKMLQRWAADQERRPLEAINIPPSLQRAILDFMEQEFAQRLAPLETTIAEQQVGANDLASENERQADTIEAQVQEISELAADKASAEGKAVQLENDLVAARKEAQNERQAAELARTELAKAQLRLEGLPRLEADLATVRADLDNARRAAAVAEQSVAVLAAQKADIEQRLSDTRALADQAAGVVNQSNARIETLAKSLAAAERDSAELAAERELTAKLRDKVKELEIAIAVASSKA